MISTMLLLAAIAAQQAPSPTAGPPPPAVAAAVVPRTQSNSRPEQISEDLGKKLLQVRRIYVDTFGDDTISKQVQAMVINSLSDSKRFIITENKDKADAVLKGTGLEKTSQEFHGMSEGTGVASAAGGHHGSVSGSFVNGTGSVVGSSFGGFAAHAARIDDAVASTETINDA